MKLNLSGFRTYCERKGMKDYKGLTKELGEKTVLEIIDFGEETLNGFKSKNV